MNGSDALQQYAPLVIAKWLINKGIDSDRYLSNLVINKLAYFAQGFSYRINEAPLIAIDNLLGYPVFEAWKYGPVSPNIYHAYKMYGNKKITARAETGIITIEGHRFLSEFWSNFATKYTPIELVSMAHAPNSAWSRAKEEGLSVIPEEYVREEFARER